MVIDNNDCIAAISTPAGSGGIAIIRISGKDAFFTADKLFCRNKKGVLSFADVSGMKSHTLQHGYIFDSESHEMIDEVLISKMDGPKTYTGEDTVEVNCHGGYAVAIRVLSLAFKAGARAAEPGEFTKRAFLNGKLDLAQAESVMDIISAKTESGRKAAIQGLSGRLGDEINDLCHKLTEALANIDVSIDYPEYEFDEEMGDAALKIINETIFKLQKLSDSYSEGRLAKEGIKLVIAGAPNAGKSSLMNIFSGTERSIVTDIPGTTRDTIDEEITLGGFPIWVTDTAGIRETDDVVEKIGVNLAREKMQDADIVLYVIDCANVNKEEIANLAANIPVKSLVIANKLDKEEAKSGLKYIRETVGTSFEILEISAKTKEGIDRVFDKIKEMCNLGKIDFNNENILTSERHHRLVDQSLELLARAKDSNLSGMPIDLVAQDLRLSIDKLCEVLGKNVSEEVVDNIFSRFCVGK